MGEDNDSQATTIFYFYLFICKHFSSINDFFLMKLVLSTYTDLSFF